MESLLYLKSILKFQERQPMPYNTYCSNCSCFVVVPADPQPSSHGVLANAPQLQLVLAMRACILLSVCCRCKSGFQKIVCKHLKKNINIPEVAIRYLDIGMRTATPLRKAFMVMCVFVSAVMLTLELSGHRRHLQLPLV